MKRSKVMLTAIALLAVVGAALAFKAQPGTSICIGSDQNDFCTGTLVDKTAQLVGSTPTFYYSPKPANVACEEVECTIGANRIVD
jgi:hypothetical protein